MDFQFKDIAEATAKALALHNDRVRYWNEMVSETNAIMTVRNIMELKDQYNSIIRWIVADQLIKGYYTSEDEYRNIAASQCPCPAYNSRKIFLTLDDIEKILDNLKFTSTVFIDIVYTASHSVNYTWNDLVSLLSKFSFSYRIHLYSEDCNIITSTNSDKTSQSNISLFVYKDRFSVCDNSDIKDIVYPITVKKLVYDEQDMLSDNDSLLPVWTGENSALFSKYVWTSRQDIDECGAKFNTIFRNQKVNSNFFGLFDIEPDGSIYIHGSTHCINNIHNLDFSLVDLVIDELKNNRTWRLTRDCTKCKPCPYRFICPPVSLIELQYNDINVSYKLS